MRWPLPFPAEEFIARPTELAAWVAVDGDVVVGHVALSRSAPGGRPTGGAREPGSRHPPWRPWRCSSSTRPPPAAASAARLLTTAVERARALGRTPVLDVVSESTRAVELYARHGWQVVGRARPPWLPADREPLLLMALPDDAQIAQCPRADDARPAEYPRQCVGRARPTGSRDGGEGMAPGVTLAVIGAIFTFAVRAYPTGIDQLARSSGVILMVAGAGC